MHSRTARKSVCLRTLTASPSPTVPPHCREPSMISDGFRKRSGNISTISSRTVHAAAPMRCRMTVRTAFTTRTTLPSAQRLPSDSRKSAARMRNSVWRQFSFFVRYADDKSSFLCYHLTVERSYTVRKAPTESAPPLSVPVFRRHFPGITEERRKKE